MWRGDREALSLVQVPAMLQPGLERYVFHPAVSDACGHVLTATISLDKSDADKGGAFVGGSVDETRVYVRPRGHQFWAYARLRPDAEQQSNILIGDVQVIDENGIVISETLGAHLWYLDKSAQRALSESMDDWFYDIQWEPAVRSVTQSIGPGTWLILSDRSGVGEQLTMALKARGDRTISATIGDAYARVDEDHYCIRADQADDLRQMIGAVVSAGRVAWRGVVHLWSLDAPALTGRESLDIAQTLNTVSVLHLIQTLAPIEWQEFPRIWLITRGAQSIDASPVALAQTPVWGLGRTLALEHSELWGGLIDLDAAATPAEAANDLLSEIVDRSREDQIAFRGGQRYVARLAHHTRSVAEAPAFQLRAEASYLITGGLGGLGLQLGRWLAEQGAWHIVLMGRTPLPPRAEWDQAEAGGRIAQQIAAIQTIEALGATVHLAAVDVADEAQLRSYVAAYQSAQPAIRGVIHAAGILRHHPLIECEAAEMAEVLRAKVAGSWHVQQLLGDQLDFFVLFSSASALLSSPRLGSYAAANAFLDGLAHYRRACGQPALSVNWGVWADEGMAAQFDRDDVALITLRGMGTLSTQQGLDALQNLMQQTAAQVGVLPVNWRRWQELYPAFVDAPFLAHVVQRPKQAAATRPPALSRDRLLAADLAERQTLLQTYLNSLAAKTMGVANLDSKQPLNELGLDSLMAVEIKNRIESDLGVVVPMVKLLQGPSIVQLAAYALEHVTVLEPTAGTKPLVTAKLEDQQLLAQLDQLSDDQVDALLTDLLIAGGQPDD